MPQDTSTTQYNGWDKRKKKYVMMIQTATATMKKTVTGRDHMILKKLNTVLQLRVCLWRSQRAKSMYKLIIASSVKKRRYRLAHELFIIVCPPYLPP